MTSKFGVAAVLILGTLLLTAQVTVQVHAYQHDPGTPASQACTDCVTAGQLLAACAPHAPSTEARPYSTVAHCSYHESRLSTHSNPIHLRGPPTLV